MLPFALGAPSTAPSAGEELCLISLLPTCPECPKKAFLGWLSQHQRAAALPAAHKAATCPLIPDLAALSPSGWAHLQQLPASHYSLTAGQRTRNVPLFPQHRQGSSWLPAELQDELTKALCPHYFPEFCAAADGSSLGWVQLLG